MKKIGIVTIRDYRSYGNRLQNYAMHQLVKSVGYQPVNIEISRSDFKGFIKYLAPISISSRWELHNAGKKMAKRMKRFIKFSYDTMGKPVKVSILWKKREKCFSYFIAGSDQIWNPDWTNNDYFLTFTEPRKRIAIAASIGRSMITEKVSENYRPMLQQMHYISVREEAAAAIVENIIGKSVDVFLDPTMLVEQEHWKQLARKPEVELPPKYIVSFFLGELPRTMVEEWSRQKGLPVVCLNNDEYPELFCVDPPEFLYILQHASYVLTDSFHGTVFSILFERQFFCFFRKFEEGKNMFSRMETLLSCFQLEERAQFQNQVQELPDISEEKWKTVREKLKVERKRAIRILEGLVHGK